MKIRCKHCDDVIAPDRHNIICCKCGKVTIDGRNDQIKISGYIGDPGVVIEQIMDEYIEDAED